MIDRANLRLILEATATLAIVAASVTYIVVTLGRPTARDLGLDLDSLAACARTEAPSLIAAAVARATELGVVATPTFFIGLLGSDGMIAVQTVVSGAKPIGEFKEAIEKILTIEGSVGPGPLRRP